MGWLLSELLGCAQTMYVANDETRSPQCLHHTATQHDAWGCSGPVRNMS
jgi:hypothetical protein